MTWSRTRADSAKPKTLAGSTRGPPRVTTILPALAASGHESSDDPPRGARTTPTGWSSRPPSELTPAASWSDVPESNPRGFSEAKDASGFDPRPSKGHHAPASTRGVRARELRRSADGSEDHSDRMVLPTAVRAHSRRL